jgi:hypothetical protein
VQGPTQLPITRLPTSLLDPLGSLQHVSPTIPTLAGPARLPCTPPRFLHPRPRASIGRHPPPCRVLLWRPVRLLLARACACRAANPLAAAAAPHRCRSDKATAQPVLSLTHAATLAHSRSVTPAVRTRAVGHRRAPVHQRRSDCFFSSPGRESIRRALVPLVQGLADPVSLR